MDTLLHRYAVALTHLYGVLNKDRLHHIYNLYESPKASFQEIEALFQTENESFLSDHHMEARGDAIVLMGEEPFESNLDTLTLMKAKGLYYIPEKEELLRYENESYVQKPLIYEEVRHHLLTYHFAGDEKKTDFFLEDLVNTLRFTGDYECAISLIEEAYFKDGDDAMNEDLVALTRELGKDIRMRKYRGYTEREIHELIKE